MANIYLLVSSIKRKQNKIHQSFFSNYDMENPVRNNPTNIYLHKVNKRNTRRRCEICSKLTIKTPEQMQWYRSGVLTVIYGDHLTLDHVIYIIIIFRLLPIITQEKTVNFRRNKEFQIPRVNTILKGSKSIKYFAPIVWDLIP